MAKMFYTLEETKAALGRNEEGIKQLSREGRLREFRDGPRLMFKADQVDSLKADMAGGGAEISLAPDAETPAEKSGSSMGLSAGDTRGGGEAVGGTGAGITPPKPGGSGLMDLGGTAAGSSISLGAPAGGTSAGAAAQGTRAGITIFDVDEAHKVDPSAQTAISGGGTSEQLSLENVGSGSGLLDLTRESDDTSLGAVFDDLGPGKAGTAAGGRSAGLEAPPLPSGPAVIETRGRAVASQVFIEAPDPVGVAMGAACIVPCVCLGFAGFVIFASTMGYRPEIMDKLVYPGGQLLIYAAAAFVATIVFGMVGYFVAGATQK
jgi:hypothetical protein